MRLSLAAVFFFISLNLWAQGVQSSGAGADQRPGYAPNELDFATSAACSIGNSSSCLPISRETLNNLYSCSAHVDLVGDVSQIGYLLLNRYADSVFFQEIANRSARATQCQLSILSGNTAPVVNSAWQVFQTLQPLLQALTQLRDQEAAAQDRELRALGAFARDGAVMGVLNRRTAKFQQIESSIEELLRQLPFGENEEVRASLRRMAGRSITPQQFSRLYGGTLPGLRAKIEEAQSELASVRDASTGEYNLSFSQKTELFLAPGADAFLRQMDPSGRSLRCRLNACYVNGPRNAQIASLILLGGATIVSLGTAAPFLTVGLAVGAATLSANQAIHSCFQDTMNVTAEIQGSCTPETLARTTISQMSKTSCAVDASLALLDVALPGSGLLRRTLRNANAIETAAVAGNRAEDLLAGTTRLGRSSADSSSESLIVVSATASPSQRATRLAGRLERGDDPSSILEGFGYSRVLDPPPGVQIFRNSEGQQIVLRQGERLSTREADRVADAARQGRRYEAPGVSAPSSPSRTLASEIGGDRARIVSGVDIRRSEDIDRALADLHQLGARNDPALAFGALNPSEKSRALASLEEGLRLRDPALLQTPEFLAYKRALQDEVTAYAGRLVGDSEDLALRLQDELQSIPGTQAADDYRLIVSGRSQEVIARTPGLSPEQAARLEAYGQRFDEARRAIDEIPGARIPDSIRSTDPVPPLTDVATGPSSVRPVREVASLAVREARLRELEELIGQIQPAMIRHKIIRNGDEVTLEIGLLRREDSQVLRAIHRAVSSGAITKIDAKQIINPRILPLLSRLSEIAPTTRPLQVVGSFNVDEFVTTMRYAEVGRPSPFGAPGELLTAREIQDVRNALDRLDVARACQQAYGTGNLLGCRGMTFSMDGRDPSSVRWVQDGPTDPNPLLAQYVARGETDPTVVIPPPGTRTPPSSTTPRAPSTATSNNRTREMLTPEEMAIAGAMEDGPRMERARELIGDVSDAQEEAILRAHRLGEEYGIGNYPPEILQQKAEILQRAGISRLDRRKLFENGIVGSNRGVDPTLSSSELRSEGLSLNNQANSNYTLAGRESDPSRRAELLRAYQNDRRLAGQNFEQSALNAGEGINSQSVGIRTLAAEAYAAAGDAESLSRILSRGVMRETAERNLQRAKDAIPDPTDPMYATLRAEADTWERAIARSRTSTPATPARTTPSRAGETNPTPSTRTPTTETPRTSSLPTPAELEALIPAQALERATAAREAGRFDEAAELFARASENRTLGDRNFRQAFLESLKGNGQLARNHFETAMTGSTNERLAFIQSLHGSGAWRGMDITQKARLREMLLEVKQGEATLLPFSNGPHRRWLNEMIADLNKTPGLSAVRAERISPARNAVTESSALARGGNPEEARRRVFQAMREDNLRADDLIRGSGGLDSRIARVENEIARNPGNPSLLRERDTLIQIRDDIRASETPILQPGQPVRDRPETLPPVDNQGARQFRQTKTYRDRIREWNAENERLIEEARRRGDPHPQRASRGEMTLQVDDANTARDLAYQLEIFRDIRVGTPGRPAARGQGWENFIGDLEASALNGRLVGLERKLPDGTSARIRLDWDPQRGGHYNIDIRAPNGNGKMEDLNLAIGFRCGGRPCSEQEVFRLQDELVNVSGR